MNKELPKNIEAEKNLLGSMFWSYESLQKGFNRVMAFKLFYSGNKKRYLCQRNIFGFVSIFILERDPVGKRIQYS